MQQIPFLRLSFNAGKSISTQFIVDEIGAAVRGKKAPPGSRLPPVRVLAHQLHCSKNTVAKAYEELKDRGVIQSSAKKGYFVSEETRSSARAPRHSVPMPSYREAGIFVPPTREDAKRILLSNVFIDRELLPFRKIEQCFRSVLRKPGLHYLYDSHGFKPLRELIAKRLNKRGIEAEADWIVTTTGSQQALDICVKSIRMETIATENPTYGMGRKLFEINKLKVVGLDIDPFQGMNLSLWRERLAHERPQALYITTNFNNPTGYSYSSAELEGIIELANEFSFSLIEDDWGSDMLPYSEFRPPLRALAGTNVLYINSFTKKLLPSLRIGYALANSEARPSLLTAKRASALGLPTIIEATLFEFIDRGYYDQHLRHLQAELDVRYKNCLDSLTELMPDTVKWTTPGGGPVLWLEIPKWIPLAAVRDYALKRDVVVDADTSYNFMREPHLHGFKIGYAFLSTEKMRRGVEVLAEAIKKLSSVY